MQLLLAAMAGGALGAGARYLVNVAAALLLGSGFPWATLIVNVSGSFAMGLLAAFLLPRFGGSPALLWTFLATGILGGFTTFSAFSLDVVALIERREVVLASVYAVASFGLSVLALIAGQGLGRAALP